MLQQAAPATYYCSEWEAKMPVDVKSVRAFVKEVLKHGTPDWIRFPEDYKYAAQEWDKQVREDLINECRQYRDEDQEVLSDVVSRRVNPMRASMFMKKLRANGVKCFSHTSQLNDGTASLFCVTPDAILAGPVCSIQIPMMWEWTTLRLDPRTQLPSGWRDIGWRTAQLWLIKKRVLTEEKAYEIFGRPRVSRVSKVWRRQLHAWKNGLEAKKDAR
jgi:hypothetical protein